MFYDCVQYERPIEIMYDLSFFLFYYLLFNLFEGNDS